MGVKDLKMAISLKCFVVVLLLVQSSHGLFSQCKLTECERLAPRFQMFQLNGPPNGAQLNALCPHLSSYVLCLQEKVQSCLETGSTQITRRESLMKEAHEVITLSNIVLDVCNKDSTLHKGYVANIGCALETFKVPDSTCYETAKLVYSTYESTALDNRVESDDVSNDIDENKCLITGYTMSCILGRLNQQCGEEAGNTVIEFLSRLKNTRFDSCSPDELAILRGPFLDMLEATEGENTDIFKKVMAVLKKKK